jgi:hypothetical protein
MGFLDKLRGGRRDSPEDVASPRRRYPSRSRLNDPGVGTLTDLERHYPLPAEFEYRERAKGDFVVVRRSDGREYVFLVEEGILAWDEPYTRKDGSLGYRTTEVLRQSEAEPLPGRSEGQLAVPSGSRRITDPDVLSFADLDRYFPLPTGFEYQRTDEGYPVVGRLADGAQLEFLIEEGMLSFDEPYTRENARTGYRTTEVFKRA